MSNTFGDYWSYQTLKIEKTLHYVQGSNDFGLHGAPQAKEKEENRKVTIEGGESCPGQKNYPFHTIIRKNKKKRTWVIQLENENFVGSCHQRDMISEVQQYT